MPGISLSRNFFGIPHGQYSMNRLITLVYVLAFAPQVALAQTEQTVEGAQKFLSQIIAQGASTIDLDVGEGFGNVPAKKTFCRIWYDNYGNKQSECGDTKNGTYRIEPYMASSAVATTRCLTIIESSTKHESVFNESAGGHNQRLIVLTLPRGPFHLDWSKIAEIEQTGSAVLIRGVKPALRINLPSEQLAVRFAYAMEFLRINCDATSGTGF